MSLYLPSGYLNAASLFDDPSPFVFLIGARGIGKTYGALKYVKDNSLRFVYLRMTDIEVKNLSGASFNVFKSINEDTGSEIQTRREKNVVRFGEMVVEGCSRYPCLFAYIRNGNALIFMFLHEFQ